MKSSDFDENNLSFSPETPPQESDIFIGITPKDDPARTLYATSRLYEKMRDSAREEGDEEPAKLQEAHANDLKAKGYKILALGEIVARWGEIAYRLKKEKKLINYSIRVRNNWSVVLSPTD
jgi:hypothetical protein